MLLTYKDIVIFFGNRDHAIDKESVVSVVLQPEWHTIRAFLGADTLYGMNQCHGIEGVSITKGTTVAQVLGIQADFLYTEQKGYALAIMSADCVPIFFYDEKNKIIMAVHAGWKGLVADIIRRAIHTLKNIYQTHVKDVEVFIGPAARGCCYEVQEDTYKKMCDAFVREVSYTSFFAQQKGNAWYVDLVGFTIYMLRLYGISSTHINEKYAFCTLCTPEFCSYRREKSGWRNVNAIILKS